MARTKDEIAAALLKEALDYSTQQLGTSNGTYGKLELSGHDRTRLRKLLNDYPFGVQAAQNWLLEFLTDDESCELSDEGLLINIPYNCDVDGDDEFPFCGQLFRVDDDLWAIVQYVYTRDVEMDGTRARRMTFGHPATQVFLFRSEGAARAAFFGFRMANTAWRLSTIEEFESDDDEAAA